MSLGPIFSDAGAGDVDDSDMDAGDVDVTLPIVMVFRGSNGCISIMFVSFRDLCSTEP